MKIYLTQLRSITTTFPATADWLLRAIDKCRFSVSRDDILLLPVEQLASVVARGELLQLTTIANQRFTLAHRLHDLERRLDPTQFIRLSRSTLANLALIQRVSPMPGGTYLVTLSTGHQLGVSRLRARALRNHLLRL
jgi:two-component system LytT family response regulator